VGLEWLAAVGLPQEGNVHEDLQLVLRLFMLGTRVGEQVLRSSKLKTAREAWHMAALNASYAYFDFANLEQLVIGTVHTLHCAAVSRKQAVFLAAFASLNAPGPVALHLPLSVVPLLLGHCPDRLSHVGINGETETSYQLEALLGGTEGALGDIKPLDDSLLGLKCGSCNILDLTDCKVSLEALQVLDEAARWWYGRGASRASLVRSLRRQQEYDSPEGVAQALDVVWAHTQDGRALAALSDPHLLLWGAEDAIVHAAVLHRVVRRLRVPVDVENINFDSPRCITGLGSVDGGLEAMQLVLELLLVLSPGVMKLSINACCIGDAGA